MSRLVRRAVLSGSGSLLGLIGGALMFTPKEFLEMSHVIVERDPGLMSELVAPSGVLIITSAFMMLGAIKPRFANTGLSMGAIVYGSYGIGRLISMALHGLPSGSLVAAMVIELAVAAVLIVLRLASTPHKERRIAEAYTGDATA